MADLISPSLDRQTARGLTDRLKLPLVVAPMFKVSTPELVVASCRAGAIGSFPSINARTPGLFDGKDRSEEHTSELQSLMRIPSADFCFKKKKNVKDNRKTTTIHEYK